MKDSCFIRNFIYVIGGFTQKTGSDTGLMRLWARLFKWRAKNYDHAFTFLMPREWDDATKEMAELVKRHAIRDANPGIIIVGYSWGAGYGSIQLAKSLAKKKRTVDLMLLIDPVYRSKLPLIFRLLAYTTWFGIKIPPNVLKVAVWRQNNNGPRGTKIKLEDKSKTIILFEEDVSDLGLTHSTIQYHEPVLQKCLQLIGSEVA